MSRRKECAIKRRKSYNCSMNFIFCGCFGARHDCPEVKNAPIEKSNSELLPSSAIASMERLKLIGSSGYSSSPASALDCSTVACPQINLPSSVLLTHACLSRNKVNDKAKIDKSDGPKFTKPARLPFRLRHGKQRIKGNGFTVSNDKEDQIVEPASGDETADDNDLQHTLVFSPLPSQIVPDVVVEKQSNTTLLGPRSETDKGKKCFVIDLDETLVHSSFKIVDNADFKVGVEIDGITHRVYVLKRPHVDTFLSRMANLYECVLFTASLAKYADPVADFLDKWCTFRFRLFRESCVYHRGNYVKDLSLLGRPINQIVILDNSPASYMFHASHAVQISSWFDDPHDRVLLDLIPYFENLAAHPNVEDFLRSNPSPTPFAAVGTVGLPLTALPQIPLVSDLAGRSADGGTIISNIRRPTVASPLPSSTVSSEPNQFRDDYRRSLVTQSNAMKHVNPRTLPVINKLSSTGTGPSIRKSYPNQEGTNSHASFPTPLSLATYVPISSSTTPVAISKPTSGTTTQAYVPIASNNSNAVSLTTVPVSNNSPNFSLNISHPSSSSMTFSTTMTSSSQVYQPRTVRTTNQHIESSKTVWSNHSKLPVTSVHPLSPITACATTVSPSISVTQRPASCRQEALP